MYSGNRKPIVITAAIIAVVCIAVAMVIFITGCSAEKRLEEETSTEEEVSADAAAADRGSYVDEIAAIADASVGDIIYFGSYEQDNDLTNGTEPIAWYVLDKADGEATLLSVYLLDHQPYHKWNMDITWEKCTLRSWLNDEFYHTAFSEEEQAAIVNTNVINEDNPYYLFHGEGGNDTMDKVWLLSLGEIEQYFHIDMDFFDEYWHGYKAWYEYAIYCCGQDNRLCAKPTVYAEAEGVSVYSEEYAQSSYSDWDDSCVGNGWWWLRSPGYSGCYAANVAFAGSVAFSGRLVDVDNYSVRPALKVAY